MCQARVGVLNDAYNGLTAAQKKHIYLLATSKESQQDGFKTNFCKEAENGANIAECTDDEISTGWFNAETDQRFVIWFFRDPANDCQWQFHDRYSTNAFSDLRTKLQQTLVTLLDASATCTGGLSATTNQLPSSAPDSAATATAATPTTTLPSDPRCPIVIDTRTQLEWDEGHAHCAHRLEIQDDPTLAANVSTLANDDLTYPVQLYCRSGNRAGRARKTLQEQGWTHVTNAGGWESGQADAVKELCDCTTTTAAVATAATPQIEIQSDGTTCGVPGWRILLYTCMVSLHQFFV